VVEKYDLIKSVNTRHKGSVIVIKFFIREVRENKNLSQEELAKLSGVSSSHIGFIENGERQPTLLVICKLARALNVDVADLYEYHE